MAEDWLEHTVQVEVPISIDRVWDLWANLELMPNWMRWIRSVELIDAELSRWTLDTRGLTFSWISKTHTVHKHQMIGWASVEGLPNRGALRFYDRKGSTIVKLSVSYMIPGILGKIMDNLFLGRLVESSLQADMERFKEYALQQAEA